MFLVVELILVSFFSILISYNSLKVIIGRTGIESGISLILVFINVSGLLICIGLDMFGLLLLVIYVGAVAILILFVIMMINEDWVVKTTKFQVRFVSVFVPLIGLSVGLDKRLLVCDYLSIKELWSMKGNVDSIGENLLTVNMYNVIGVGLVLLIGMIGGVVLCKE